MAGTSRHPRAALRAAAAQLVEALEWERGEGVAQVEVAPSTLRALAAPGAPRGERPAAALPLPPPPPAPPPVRADAADARAGLDAIAAEIAACTRCGLHRTRCRTVPGQGCPTPQILFVGEGPGREEDLQGLAFVGPAGALLTRIVEAMGLTRDQVFIANIVKCRPTVDGAGAKDRPPEPGEMEACLPYLKRQIACLRPKAIVALGGTALQGLFNLSGITRHRGRWLRYEGIDAMPTYHPSYLLRGGAEAGDRFWEVWDDMAEVLRRLGRPVPGKRRPPRAS